MTKRNQNTCVFALTSKGNDYYSAMTRVAVASLRITNPNITITIACDQESDESMRVLNDPLVTEVDNWLPLRTPAGESTYRNRFVKTALRSVINGPFLFLDSDVLVRGDLSELFRTDCDVAGARNHSQGRLSQQIWSEDLDELNRLN